MPEETQENAQVAQETQTMSDAERMEVFNQTAIAEAERARQQEPELPDDDEPTSKIKNEFAQKEKEYQEKLKKLEQERETFDKRLRDTQHKLHMVTAEKTLNKDSEPEKADASPTFDDYVNNIVSKFEESPADAVKQMIKDFAADRDVMRRQYADQIEKLRESVVQEIASSTPENAKYAAMVEDLNQNRPDLSNLSFKQKLEFVKIMDAANKKTGKQKDEDDGEEVFDRNLLSNPKRNAVKSNGLPSWVNSPEIQKMAVNNFSSKREMLDWTDPSKAMEMARKIAEHKRGQ
jgi:hypothetical protein